MRKTANNQLDIPFIRSLVPSEKSKKYENIEKILLENQEIFSLAANDLTKNLKNSKTGSEGMSAEQVIRFFIVKQIEGLSYRKLEDDVNDSIALRNFCHIGVGKSPKFTAIQQNIKKLMPETLKKFNDIIVLFAKKINFEKGRKLRIDATTVESNIHFPTDNSLIWDCVRVANRLAEKANEELFEGEYYFPNRTRIVKRLHFHIVNVKGKGAVKKRKHAFKRLIDYGEEVLGESKKLLEILENYEPISADKASFKSNIIKEYQTLIPHFEKVLNQTKRRIFDNEKLPPSEKIVSIFEPHTDIIKKGDRDTEFGHKICLTGGESNLILDCIMDRGNPKDSTLYPDAIDRQIDLYGKPPLKSATDGGFASKDNAKYALGKGVRDVVFTKGMKKHLEEWVKSMWVFKQLRKFRAGIEACISLAKRCFGLSRCNWSGWESFKSYVWSCIIAYNLNLLATQADF